MEASEKNEYGANQLLAKCALEAEFPYKLAQELLMTVQASFANLGRWGAKAELEHAITEIICKDVRQSEKAVSNDIQ